MPKRIFLNISMKNILYLKKRQQILSAKELNGRNEKSGEREA